MFKKKKIQVYLNNVGDPKTAFDLLLCDYLNGSIKKDFESIGFEKISIHIDWLDNMKDTDISKLLIILLAGFSAYFMFGIGFAHILSVERF